MSIKLDSPAGRLALLVARIALAAVLLWAAVPKLGDLPAFAEAVANYRLLPAPLVGPTALVVPVVELVLAAALLSGLAARGAGLAAAVTMAIFAAAIAQATVRGIDLQCGCFGGESTAPADWVAVARNAGLAAVGLLVAAAPHAGWPWRRREPARHSAG